MKSVIAILFMATMLQGCGTIKGTASGMLDGASQDLKSLSDKVR